MKVYPLEFRPIYKPRIWGGRKLQEVFGKDLPEGEKIGESWELADLPEDKSVIANDSYSCGLFSHLKSQRRQEVACRLFGLLVPLSRPAQTLA